MGDPDPKTWAEFWSMEWTEKESWFEEMRQFALPVTIPDYGEVRVLETSDSITQLSLIDTKIAFRRPDTQAWYGVSDCSTCRLGGVVDGHVTWHHPPGDDAAEILVNRVSNYPTLLWTQTTTPPGTRQSPRVKIAAPRPKRGELHRGKP